MNLRTQARMSWARLLGLAALVLVLSGASVDSEAGNSPHATGNYSINFNLNYPSTTSAGVFGSDGHLVRTLWGNRSMSAGSYNRTWDGNDDSGNPVATDSYQVKLLIHNVQPNWEGTIGNSSTYMTGTTKIHGIGTFIDVLT